MTSTTISDVTWFHVCRLYAPELVNTYPAGTSLYMIHNKDLHSFPQLITTRLTTPMSSICAHRRMGVISHRPFHSVYVWNCLNSCSGDVVFFRTFLVYQKSSIRDIRSQHDSVQMYRLTRGHHPKTTRHIWMRGIKFTGWVHIKTTSVILHELYRVCIL